MDYSVEYATIAAAAMGLTSFLKNKVPFIEQHGLSWFVALLSGPVAALALWYFKDSSIAALTWQEVVRVGIMVSLITNGAFDGQRAITAKVSDAVQAMRRPRGSADSTRGAAPTPALPSSVKDAAPRGNG